MPPSPNRSRTPESSRGSRLSAISAPPRTSIAIPASATAARTSRAPAPSSVARSGSRPAHAASRTPREHRSRPWLGPSRARRRGRAAPSSSPGRTWLWRSITGAPYGFSPTPASPQIAMEARRRRPPSSSGRSAGSAAERFPDVLRLRDERCALRLGDLRLLARRHTRSPSPLEVNSRDMVVQRAGFSPAFATA